MVVPDVRCASHNNSKQKLMMMMISRKFQDNEAKLCSSVLELFKTSKMNGSSSKPLKAGFQLLLAILSASARHSLPTPEISDIILPPTTSTNKQFSFASLDLNRKIW